MTTVREYVATLPERRAVTEAVLQPIQRGKRDRTIVSAFKRLAPGSDGRIHTGLSIATTSGRLASSGTIVEEASTNLQNQVKKIAAIDPLYNTRDVMLADEGFQLVCPDFAGAEMLLAFAYSEDWEWVDRLLAGENVHALHAKEFFNLSCHWSEVKKKHPEVYTTSKNLGFLSVYQGSARTATVTFNKDFPVHGLRTTEKEVKRVQEILYQLHPLPAWWMSVDHYLRRNDGIIRNCFGGQRPLRDPDEHNRLKDALSFLPQSTVAWKMNKAIIAVHDKLDREGEIELLHQNHDELDIQCLPECLDETLKFTQNIMGKPFKIQGNVIQMPVEFKVSEVGGSWGSAREYTR